MKIKLPYSDTKTFRNEMPELEVEKASKVYWVGCVSSKDKEKVESFMSAANNEDIDGLKKFFDIGGDLLYAVILEIEKVNKLFVVMSLEDPNSNEECIFSKTLEFVKIEGYKSNVEEIGKELLKDCKITFFDVIKIIFNRKNSNEKIKNNKGTEIFNSD